MRRAAIYTRISEDRAGQELGVTRQLEAARQLAADRGWDVVAEFSDNDISAYRGSRRAGYDELMAAVQAGRIDRIIAMHPSRLWRNNAQRSAAFELLKAARVGLAFVSAPDIDLSTAAGRMLAEILGAFDTAESEVKAERISAAARQRAKAGKNHGSRRAYGYAKNGLEIVPAEAAALTEAARQLLAGVPLGSVTRWMNESGHRTVRGHEWAPGVLKDNIRLPRHAGHSIHLGEIVGVGQWPPIFSQETHQALVTLFADPSRKTSTGNRAAYLLSGIARCGVCGAAITAHGRKRYPNGTELRLYRCRPAIGKSGYCVGRRMDWVDGYVIDVIVGRLSREDARGLLVAEDRPDVAALQDEAAALRVRLDGLADAFALGEINRSQLQTGSARLQGRLDEIGQATAHVSRSPVLADLVNAEDVRAAWDRLSLARQREVVKTLMVVTILPGGGGRKSFDPDLVQIDWVA